MSKTFRKDLTGQRFGRLRVLEFVPTENKDRRSYWRCKCDCGNTPIVREDYLKLKTTKSCGCLKKELTQNGNKKHGKAHTRIYNIWRHVKDRCNNVNHIGYKDYGGRGITVCDEWQNDFQAFYDWAMSNGYANDLTIDRIDNDKGYSPENCRWANVKKQSRNRRSTIIVEFNGEKMCISEAAEQCGINPYTLYSRYRAGDRGDRLFRPIDK